MKTELIELLKRLAMGRPDAAEQIADILMPDKVESPEKVYKKKPEKPAED